jgi:hypothetical protein
MTINEPDNPDTMPRKRKVKISISIDTGLLEWIDKKKEEFVFQSRSHAVEQAVFELKKAREPE